MVNGSTPAEVEITEETVRGLLRAQCPHMSDLPLVPFNNGWDNDIWALGEDLLVRLPRRQVAAHLVENEQQVLPLLAPRLPLPVPEPVHAGTPHGAYPWCWSVVPRFPGARAAESVLTDQEDDARRLADFLRALHTPAAADAPENAFRGGGIASRAEGFEALRDLLSEGTAGRTRGGAQQVWNHALNAPTWDGPAVWLHGDLHSANIVVDLGRLSAVIDWGDVCSGDPACDLAVAWMLFDADGRDVFFGAYGEGYPGLQERARGWALLFGLIYLRAAEGDPLMELMSRTVLDRVLGPAV